MNCFSPLVINVRVTLTKKFLEVEPLYTFAFVMF